MSNPFRQDRVRIVIFLKKKSSISKEEFSRYWSGPHGELFKSLEIVKKNVLKYEQTHVNDKHIATCEAMGVPAADWDGMVMLDGKNHQDLIDVFLSDEYREIVFPDEENFVDRAKCQILPLDLVTVME